MIQSIIVYGAFILISLFIAKKYNYKNALKVALLGFIALYLSLWSYIAKNLIELSPEMYSLNFYIVLTLRVALALGLLFVIFEGKLRNSKS